MHLTSCENVATSCGLKTCTCHKSFDCATNAITGAFAMASDKEMPFCFQSMVSLMITQVCEVLVLDKVLQKLWRFMENK